MTDAHQSKHPSLLSTTHVQWEGAEAGSGGKEWPAGKVSSLNQAIAKGCQVATYCNCLLVIPTALMETKVEVNVVQQCMKASAAVMLFCSILSYMRIWLLSWVGKQPVDEEILGITITVSLWNNEVNKDVPKNFRVLFFLFF